MNNLSEKSIAITGVIITTFALVLAMSGTAAANDQAGADIPTYSTDENVDTADAVVAPGDNVQQAIDDNGANSVILFKDGTFDGSNFNFPITIDDENVTLVTENGPSAVTIDANGSENAIQVNAANATVKGFTIVGDTTLNAIEATSSADGLEVIHNKFLNSGDSSTGKNKAVHIGASCENVVVRYDNINGYMYGVTADVGENVNNLTVQNSIFNIPVIEKPNDNEAGGLGVQLWHGNNLQVENNTFTGSLDEGTKSYYTSDAWQYNHYAVVSWSTFFMASDWTEIDGDVHINNNEMTNLYLGTSAFSSAGEIKNNVIDNNWIGIQVGQVDNVYATAAAQGLAIEKNDITNNHRGIWVRSFVPDGMHASNNNIVNNEEYGIYNSDENQFDATYNWWGDSSGPSGVGPGEGDAVSENVRYNPWLLEPKDVTQTYYDHCGVLNPGWNLTSVPMTLENDNISEMVASIANIEHVYRYEDGDWLEDQNAYELEPLYASFIKVDESAGSIGIGIKVSRNVQKVVPSRSLPSGWSLIGPNMNPGVESKVRADYFLESVSESYSTLYSPFRLNREGWTVTTETADTEFVYPAEGYWLFMESKDTLAGRSY